MSSKGNHRDHFVYAPSQCETALYCNTVSHWLGTYTEWSLNQAASSSQIWRSIFPYSILCKKKKKLFISIYESMDQGAVIPTKFEGLNKLWPEQNGWQFAGNILKRISVKVKCFYLLKFHCLGCCQGSKWQYDQLGSGQWLRARL